MRVLFWYCSRFSWSPTMKTLDGAPAAGPDQVESAVVAFIHVESGDVAAGSSAETKLVKNMKWLARKWDTRTVVLHSFTHLGDDKADPEAARSLFRRAGERLSGAGYHVTETPYGYFNDLSMDAPGHPLARIYKEL